jgi:hypothetical protein
MARGGPCRPRRHDAPSPAARLRISARSYLIACANKLTFLGQTISAGSNVKAIVAAGLLCKARLHPRGSRSDHCGENRREHAMRNQVGEEVRLRPVLEWRSDDQAVRWVRRVLVFGG